MGAAKLLRNGNNYLKFDVVSYLHNTLIIYVCIPFVAINILVADCDVVPACTDARDAPHGLLHPVAWSYTDCSDYET
jgi:hypothetical protein